MDTLPTQEHRSRVERMALWEAHQEQARRIACRRLAQMGRICREKDDLVQAALLSLWQATESWREDGGRSFATWADLCVRQAVLRESWRRQDWGHNANLTVYLGKWERLPARSQRAWAGNNVPESLDEPGKEDPDDVINRDLVSVLLSRLDTPFLQEVVHLHSLEGLIHREIALRLGKTYAQVVWAWQQARRALEQMAQEMERED